MSILSELLEYQTLNVEIKRIVYINVTQHSKVAQGLFTLSECEF